MVIFRLEYKKNLPYSDEIRVLSFQVSFQWQIKQFLHSFILLVKSLMSPCNLPGAGSRVGVKQLPSGSLASEPSGRDRCYFKDSSKYILYIQLYLYANHHKRSGLSKILNTKTKSALSHNFEHKFYITHISSLNFLQLNTHE